MRCSDRARRCPPRRARVKIVALQRQAQAGDVGLGAALLLAAFGTNPDTDAETVRAHAGAILLADALLELRAIRKALTAPPK